MYRIAICDDEKSARAKIAGYLSQYSESEGAKMEVLEYASANELLGKYPEGLDILFLDILMPGIDGMDAAQNIRRRDPQVCIIFITTMYQRAIEGYAVRAFGFVRKPVNYSELHHELNCALHQIDRAREQEQFVSLRCGGITYRLPISEISYCEVRNHSMHVCINGTVTEYRCPMNELEEQLMPRGFLRCHASFIVNAKQIRTVAQTHLVLADGSQVPISQRKKKEFMSALAAYIGEQM